MATERKTWKGLRWGYDEIIVSPFDSSSCEYCLTVPEVEAILAFSEMLAWSTRWESISGAEIDQDKIDVFANSLRRKLMSCGCDETDLILHRVNPDTGLMQISTDGGTTWEQDPQDPRIAGVVLLPPVTTGLSPDKCNAANAVVIGYSSMITHLIAQKAASASEAELSATIAATITAIFGGALPAAIVVIFGAIISWLLSSDATAMAAAFSSTTYAQILCALFDNIGDDGTFGDSQYAAMLAELGTKVTDAYAKTATIGLFTGLGKLGINNWAASRYSSGADCSGCVEGCTDFDSIVVGFGAENSRSGGNSINVTAAADGPHFSVRFDFGGDNVCCSPRHLTDFVSIGSITAYQWIVCGHDHTGDWDVIQAGFPSDIIPMNVLLIVGDSPWTGTLEFSAPN